LLIISRACPGHPQLAFSRQDWECDPGRRVGRRHRQSWNRGVAV